MVTLGRARWVVHCTRRRMLFTWSVTAIFSTWFPWLLEFRIGVILAIFYCTNWAEWSNDAAQRVKRGALVRQAETRPCVRAIYGMRPSREPLP